MSAARRYHDSVPLGAEARVAVQGACARDHTLCAKASRARAYTRMGEGGSGAMAMKQSSRDNPTGPVHFVLSIVPGHFGTKLTKDKQKSGVQVKAGQGEMAPKGCGTRLGAEFPLKLECVMNWVAGEKHARLVWEVCTQTCVNPIND